MMRTRKKIRIEAKVQSPTVEALPEDHVIRKGSVLVKSEVLQDKLRLLHWTRAECALAVSGKILKWTAIMCVGRQPSSQTKSESIPLDKAPDAGSRDAPPDTRTHPYHNICSSAR